MKLPPCAGVLLFIPIRRKSVKKVGFISSPGYLDGLSGARERAGLPAGTGPYRVITPEAGFGYDEETRYMKLRQ